MTVQNLAVQGDQWMSFLCCYVVCEMEKTICPLPFKTYIEFNKICACTNETAARYLWNKKLGAWASAEIFPGGGKSTFCWYIFFRVVGDATLMDVGLYKKVHVECYGNSCTQCLPCKKTLHWANVCSRENGYFKTKLHGSRLLNEFQTLWNFRIM